MVILPHTSDPRSGSKHFSESITACTIANDSLKPYLFFGDHSSVSYEQGVRAKEIGDPGVHFSADKKTLYIPRTDENNTLSGQYRSYKYNGEKFVKVNQD